MFVGFVSSSIGKEWRKGGREELPYPPQFCCRGYPTQGPVPWEVYSHKGHGTGKVYPPKDTGTGKAYVPSQAVGCFTFVGF